MSDHDQNAELSDQDEVLFKKREDNPARRNEADSDDGELTRRRELRRGAADPQKQVQGLEEKPEEEEGAHQVQKRDQGDPAEGGRAGLHRPLPGGAAGGLRVDKAEEDG